MQASCLFNLLRFIKWPDDSFSDGARFNFCLVEAERFGSALDAIAGERVKGRRIHMRFEINQGAARASGLVISSGLLALAVN